MTTYFRQAFGDDHPSVVAKRRKFLPMLTRGSDGQPLGESAGVLVEWYDSLLPGWVPVDISIPFFAHKLLTDECGISFTGEQPPMFMMDDGLAARVRVTAVVESDSRITAVAVRQPTSVNPQVNERVLDVGHGFHARSLHPFSNYYSDVNNGLRAADVTDGRAALRDFVNQAREAWDQAQCAGHMRLEGLDRTNYKVGDLITSIEGRNVTLPLNYASGSDIRYPQVIGIIRDVQQQKVTLAMNRFRETNALVASFLRKTKRLK
jgi:hypothetical protein